MRCAATYLGMRYAIAEARQYLIRYPRRPTRAGSSDALVRRPKSAAISPRSAGGGGRDPRLVAGSSPLGPGENDHR